MKATASILLILVISSSLFYYCYFDAMLFNSKELASQSVIAAENNHSLTVCKIPASQQAAYSDDEVWINRKLYDIAERKIINDTLYLSLYHDADEESVLSVISDFFNPDEKNSVTTPSNAPLLKSIRFIPNPLYTFDPPGSTAKYYALSHTTFIRNAEMTSLIFYDIATPPPRLS